MKSAVAIRHVMYEDAGTLAKVLAKREIHLDYVDAGTTDLASLKNDEIDLVIILGGAISANNEETYPCIKQELALIKQRLLDDRPTIGICLGAQLIAKALGSEVKKGHTYEFGWFPLTSTTHDPTITHITGPDSIMFHWHYETYDLPEGATLLASSSLYENQIYRWGKNTLGLQCHPEVEVDSLENWLIGNAFEINHAGLDVNTLREEIQVKAPILMKATAAFFNEWLADVGL